VVPEVGHRVGKPDIAPLFSSSAAHVDHAGDEDLVWVANRILRFINPYGGIPLVDLSLSGRCGHTFAAAGNG
jgi:hypothetical protein